MLTKAGLKTTWKRCLSLLKRCFTALLLPLVLTLLLVAQNAAFNFWLHITPQAYPRMLAAAFALGMLVYGPAACLRPRWRYSYLAVVSIAVSAILVAEYLYYSYAGGFLQVSALKLTGESSAVLGTAARFVSTKLLLFLANLVLVLLVGLLTARRQAFHIPLAVGEKLLVVALVLSSVFGGYGTLLAAEKHDWGNDSRLYSQMYDLNSVVGEMGVVNYFLEDAAKRALKVGQVTTADKDFVTQWAADRPVTSGAQGPEFGVAQGRNLIFIQVESLENAVLNAKIGGAEITPNLNALTQDGLYFSNYYTQVGLGNTADAEFATLDSLYPLPDSVAFVDHAQNKYAALPQLLVDHGYDTQVFHGDVATFWNRANIYPNLGYQAWHMQDEFTSTRAIGITGLGDEDFFQQALPKVEALKQPFMATLITLSSHTPFILPEDLRTLPIPDGSGLNDTQKQYLESVHYFDKAIGEFVAGLKQSGLYDNSVIVIFGDHGSYTGISQALGTEPDGVGDMNESRVPLIILAPGTGLKGERTIPGSHLDVYPTVAHLLGLEAPKSALGQDLLSTTTPVAVNRKSVTGGISAIIGIPVTYVASTDGVFERGSCLKTGTRQSVSIEECRGLYDQQSNILRVSDTTIRANLISVLNR
jgi:phosphoglycerol transferase MdoB-like AlkP superfamily enzyme